MVYHTARAYIDETYGDDRSFLIQAAFAIPAGNAETVFSEILETKIADNPRFDRSEFKGGDTSAKNRYIFQWFFQQTVNIIAEIADETPVRTIIAVDSTQKYNSDIYDKMKQQMEGSFKDLGYPASEIEVARDFIRQFIWLHARLTSLLPADGIGDVELYFDKKYRLEVQFEEALSAWVPKGKTRLLLIETRWKAYTRLFRNLLRVVPTVQNFPQVTKFTYIDSRSNYLIQAADLLTNLTLNAIRHRMGITNDLIKLKYEMLCSMMESDPIEAELLNSFTVVAGRLHCVVPDLFSRITLLT